MYVRQTQERELAFIVSGKLWRDALVMFDRETGSHWSQITGGCFLGEMTGAELEIYPSEMTTWGEWREAHPETRVLYKPMGDRDLRARYSNYFLDPERQGIFGHSIDDDRLPPKEVILALEEGGASLVFPLQHLPENEAVEAEVGRVPVILVPSGAGGHRAYERRLAGATLELELLGDALVARGTDLAWDAGTGLPRGDGAGAQPALRPLRAQVVFWFGWVSFYPDARVWEKDPSR